MTAHAGQETGSAWPEIRTAFAKGLGVGVVVGLALVGLWFLVGKYL